MSRRARSKTRLCSLEDTRERYGRFYLLPLQECPFPFLFLFIIHLFLSNKFVIFTRRETLHLQILRRYRKYLMHTDDSIIYSMLFELNLVAKIVILS